jgi:hypothetical protein
MSANKLIQKTKLSKKVTINNRKNAVIVGILILFAYAVLASSVIESKLLVSILESLSGIAVIGIAVIMFPLFKSQNKKSTIAYLSGKIVEGGLMVIAGFLFLLNFLTIRDQIYLFHTYIFILSAFIFYVLLYQSKLIPRFISVWGGIAIVLLLIVNSIDMIKNPLPMIILAIGYAPIILNEVFLAFWLIIKGFNII